MLYWMYFIFKYSTRSLSYISMQIIGNFSNKRESCSFKTYVDSVVLCNSKFQTNLYLSTYIYFVEVWSFFFFGHNVFFSYVLLLLTTVVYVKTIMSGTNNLQFKTKPSTSNILRFVPFSLLYNDSIPLDARFFVVLCFVFYSILVLFYQLCSIFCEIFLAFWCIFAVCISD